MPIYFVRDCRYKYLPSWVDNDGASYDPVGDNVVGTSLPSSESVSDNMALYER